MRRMHSKKVETELREDVEALQVDLDTLDGQLDRAMAGHKQTEEKYVKLREAFDEAAEHLVRLEGEEKAWKVKEGELTQSLEIAEEKLEALKIERDELKRLSEDSKLQLTQREDDLIRSRERLESMVADLQAKLATELRNGCVPFSRSAPQLTILISLLDSDLKKAKADSLEDEARQAKEQLAELARTASEYDALITKKEHEIAHLSEELDTLALAHSAAQKQIIQLQSQAETLSTQLGAAQAEGAASKDAQGRLQREMDALRAVVEAKSSEETRRKEVERSKEKGFGEPLGTVVDTPGAAFGGAQRGD